MSESPSPNAFSDEDLASVGIQDLPRAQHTLQSLSGQGVTDDDVAQLVPELLNSLRASPDPDRALVNFERWTRSVTSRYSHFQLLLRHPAALDIFFRVCGTSQLFSDILIENPEYFEILANPGVRARPAGAPYRELSAFIDSIAQMELKLESMRRFKKREFLRIGTRDILGLADLPTTVREFSNLADACVQKCLEIALSDARSKLSLEIEPQFAVIAMGKLGGRELNYSSDIDLMFVFDDLSGDEQVFRFAGKVAELLVSALSKDMQNGHLFRVDMRLRPEGRFGPLVRSLDSYKTYYESWGEPWEMQALIKARFVAGSMHLGQGFITMIGSYVYRKSVRPDFLAEIRRNKRKIENKAEREQTSHRNVKIGFGGIRDIEFTVQLLQLQLGGRDPGVRTANTLEGLYRLSRAGAISSEDAQAMSSDYELLRNIEHRLQILYELQTQSIPEETRERTLLARRLGFSDLSSFEQEFSSRTLRVRHFCEAYFYGTAAEATRDRDVWQTLLDGLDSDAGKNALKSKLAESGFRDAERTAEILGTVVYGTAYGEESPESRALFLSLAPRLISAATRTGDPDAAIHAIESLASASPNRAALYQSLNESQELLDRLVILAAGSPPLIISLSRHLEWLDLLVSEEVIDPSIKTESECRYELNVRIKKARKGPDDEFWRVLSNYMHRERLRIAARDLWGEINSLGAAKELSALADAVLQEMLNRAIHMVSTRYPERPKESLESLALIGLGKLGGCETGYGSDWDVLLVYDSDKEGSFETANALAEELLGSGDKLTAYDLPVTLDARLRPEGRFGALARTVTDYVRYYNEESLLWELQVLTKARYVSGNVDTAARYLEAVGNVLYGHSLTAEAQEEIRAMKRRIETERLQTDSEAIDLKLGHGGLSDIEFLAQLWQLKIGYLEPSMRATSTVGVLHALAACGAIPGPEAGRLAETYAYWIGVRNRLTLLGGLSADTLPGVSDRLRALAIGLGLTDTSKARAEAAFKESVSARMNETREIIDRFFYH